MLETPPPSSYRPGGVGSSKFNIVPPMGGLTALGTHIILGSECALPSLNAETQIPIKQCWRALSEVLQSEWGRVAVEVSFPSLPSLPSWYLLPWRMKQGQPCWPIPLLVHITASRHISEAHFCLSSISQ